MGSSDMKLDAVLQREADSMSYSNRYYRHKEGRNNNVEDSEEFIRGSPDIKRDHQITVGSRLDVL